MDRATFREAVRLASFVLEGSRYFRMTPGEAHATALSFGARSPDTFVSDLIPHSKHERWAFDSLSVMAQAILRNGYMPMPEELADWAADVLEGRRKRPPKGEKRLAKRNLAIADTVLFIKGVFDLMPTRSGAGPSKCCAAGGSACDVVGAAYGMPYKTIEGIWLEWGKFLNARSQDAYPEPIIYTG